MPVTEWDPEEADEKALEKDLKKAESTEDEDPESFLEVIEEEDQNLVADDDDVIVEENEEDDDEEEKKPSRQQRRFDQLTAQRREAERRATEASAQNKALQERLEKLEGNNNQAQLNQFQAQYQQTKSALRKAAEEGDTDAQVDLTERLADMRASARIMDMQNEQREQARMTQATAPAQGAPTTAPPQEALSWWNKNRWFNAPENVVETAAARALDEQLDQEGFDANSKEYYEELDKRLQEKFPTLYSQSATGKKKPKGPTAPTKGQGKGSSRKNSNGRLRFTRQELEVAKSLGLSSQSELKLYRAELDQQGKS